MEIARLGHEERALLLERDAIVLFIQFYVGDHVALDSTGVRVREFGVRAVLLYAFAVLCSVG